jgi:hypothetical protein
MLAPGLLVTAAMRHVIPRIILIVAALLAVGCTHHYPLVLPGDTAFCARIRESSIREGGNGFPWATCSYINGIAAEGPSPYSPFEPTSVICTSTGPASTYCVAR